MSKNVSFAVLAVVFAVIFAGGLSAQTGSSAQSFSGIITAVDAAGNTVSVRSGNSERLFVLNGNTQIEAPLLEPGMAAPEILKPGMLVNVLYSDGEPLQVAELINIVSGFQASQGQEYPFTCGNQVC
jgi:ABC-type Fe3+-hydroxamate transport system substrate-binding protein